MKFKKNYLPLNLQLFAEESEGETADNPEETEANEAEVNKESEQTKKYTDDEVNNIIDAKFAKWKAEQEEAKKLEQMNDDEKKQHELTKLEQEIETLRTEKALTEMSKVATKMLSEEKITINDNLLNLLVREKAEDTKENVSAFVELIKEQREAIKSDVLASIKQKTLTVGNAETDSEGSIGKNLGKKYGAKKPESSYFQ